MSFDICCVKEGFLLGNVTNVVTNTISDADINVVTHEVVYSMLIFCYCEMIHACKS